MIYKQAYAVKAYVVWLFRGISHAFPEEIYKFVFFACEVHVLPRKYT